jgi:hypothetical protein
MSCGRGDPGGDATLRRHRGDLMWATEGRAADVVLACLGEMVEAEADAAVLTDGDGRNSVVGFRTLEAVHVERLPPGRSARS